MSMENPFGNNQNKVEGKKEEIISGQTPTQEKGEKNIIEEEKARWVKFQQTINAHLDKLVKDGSCPARWADMKKESAATIMEVNLHPETLSERESGQLPSTFFPNSDQEAYAIQFAEIGLSYIREFQEKTEETRKSVLEKVRPLLDRVDEIVAEFEGVLSKATNQSPVLKEKLERIQEFRDNLNGSIVDFETKIEEIKQLNFNIQDKIVTQDIEASITELEELLKEYK